MEEEAEEERYEEEEEKQEEEEEEEETKEAHLSEESHCSFCKVNSSPIAEGRDSGHLW